MPDCDYRVTDTVNVVRADGSIIDANDQKAMYEFIRCSGFEFLGDAPDKYWMVIILVHMQRKAMLLIYNLMPLNALYLVARNPKDIMHLSMMTLCGVGLTTLRLTSMRNLMVVLCR